MLKSFLVSNWIVIVILLMIAAGVAGIVALQIDKVHQEQQAVARAQQLARERAEKAAEINRQEQETIRKAPDLKLLRD
ncbi:hypothetical protein [Trinickia symbiotica]|uniref:hypothetical protein n=1 Tax=Trinickia symbiotica TaxID=863227 RepID=UPI0003631A95|nr:hypothetical protein [Trinickia symbiotica]